VGAAAAGTPLRAAALPDPLQGPVEQLWFAVDDDVRFLLSRSRRCDIPGYRSVEQYAVVPTASSPRILMPALPAAAAHGAAVNYRALRGPRENLVRSVLGLAARAGIATSPTYLHVLVPASRPEAAASLPLHAVAHALGQPGLRASIGLRTGSNRKATLQLVDVDGAPAGYAKLGWNGKTDDLVRTEARALDALAADDTGDVRIPRRLASLDYGGHPVVVTEPMPDEVRAVRPDRDGPTPAEFHDLAPVSRTDKVGGIGQVTALRERLDVATAPFVAPLAQQAQRLVAEVAGDDPELVVAARWHGDLTPWNMARDGSGRLWVWDWENCEPDAPAGLDVLHWTVSGRRSELLADRLRLADCLGDAAPHLVASGVPRETWPALVRLYVATFIERECELALEHGSWDDFWIRPEQLADLADQATPSVGS
jgi:hypothetical protein